MSGSKIRTIAIAVLLVINLLFLTVIVIDTAVDARIRRDTIENIGEILRASGIMIDLGNIEVAEGLRTMRTSRVYEIEDGIVHAILGPTEVADFGVIVHHENTELGTAAFYLAGNFVMNINDGAISYTGSTERTVRSFLQDMGLEAASLTVNTNYDASTEIITVMLAYRGVGIFNSQIEFEFEGSNLRSVRGRYIAGVEPQEEVAELSPLGTALLIFLEAVRDEYREEITCSEIFFVESGYRHRVVGFFGEGVLEPAWLITTDNGRFIIDDATGEIWSTM